MIYILKIHNHTCVQLSYNHKVPCKLFNEYDYMSDKFVCRPGYTFYASQMNCNMLHLTVICYRAIYLQQT